MIAEGMNGNMERNVVLLWNKIPLRVGFAGGLPGVGKELISLKVGMSILNLK